MTGPDLAAPADRALDHVVINVLRRMDEAAELFAALGFRLTPRGHRSLGSVNHLMMTAGPYLELVGLPETGPQRQDVLDSPFGLNGLVVASRDADATHARLAAAGLAAGPPVAFTRPVTVDGREAAARFRTVRVPADRFPAGRLYHCEHLDPGSRLAPRMARPSERFFGDRRAEDREPGPGG
ncbi:VOC family protein [Methylobacterium oryzae CBMB20]